MTRLVQYRTPYPRGDRTGLALVFFIIIIFIYFFFLNVKPPIRLIMIYTCDCCYFHLHLLRFQLIFASSAVFWKLIHSLSDLSSGPFYSPADIGKQNSPRCDPVAILFAYKNFIEKLNKIKTSHLMPLRTEVDSPK